MTQATLLRANVWSLQITYKAFPHKFSNIKIKFLVQSSQIE